MSKKLGVRAFMNRLRKLNPDDWTQNAWRDDYQGHVFYCALGWMGHLHGVEQGLFDEDGKFVSGVEVTGKLADEYNIPIDTLSLIPNINDGAENWDQALGVIELALKDKLTPAELTSIRENQEDKTLSQILEEKAR